MFRLAVSLSVRTQEGAQSECLEGAAKQNENVNKILAIGKN